MSGIKWFNIYSGKAIPASGFATEEQFAAAFGTSADGERWWDFNIILFVNSTMRYPFVLTDGLKSLG